MIGPPVLDRLGDLGVIPVVVIDDPSRAAALGSALLLGGLPCAEVTLRTDTALESLRALAENPDLLVGAGTVLRPAQVEAVGGGDSFASGLIYGLMTDDDLAAAVEIGAAHGALAMTTPGDTSSATLAEVLALVSGAGARVQR